MNLYCPKCNNIIHRVKSWEAGLQLLYCRKCKSEYRAVIANGKIYEISEIKEAIGRE